MEDNRPLFMKSVSEMTPDELDQMINKAKRGTQTFKFARAEKDRFKPNCFGKAPMVISDEIIGGRYSPADGKTYENKKDWHRSFAMTGIEMMDANTPLPKRKIDKITDEEYKNTVLEAERLIDWNEVQLNPKEVEDNKRIREAMVNKYGDKKQRKSANKRKIIEGK